MVALLFLICIQPASARQHFKDRHPKIAAVVGKVFGPAKWVCKKPLVHAVLDEAKWDFQEISIGLKWLNKKLDPYADVIQLFAGISQVSTTYAVFHSSPAPQKTVIIGVPR